MKTLVTFALIFIASLVGAQTYSYATFAQHGQGYLDGALQIHQRHIKGNFSVSADLLGGVNFTSPSANAGGMVDLSYNAKTLSVFVGPAYTQTLSSLSVHTFKSDSIVIAFGIRSPINWDTLFGSKPVTSNYEAHPL
jgi:hypothetical protein